MERSKMVKKAVIPVAGFGSRMLPATKAIPKEMLPVIDRPIIQYIVEECAAAGINEIVMVTHTSKKAIEQHFQTAEELEQSLQDKGKEQLLAEVQGTLPQGMKLHYVQQGKAKGLGHAVLCGKEIIGDEPFAVILPDVLIDTNDGTDNLLEMAKAFESSNASQIMVESVAQEDISKFGIVDIDGVKINPGQDAQMKGTVEKPSIENAPSNLAVVGRYIFTPTIWSLLEQTGTGVGGEIQLTDAMDALLRQEPMHAFYMHGCSHDCGNRKGYFDAINAFAKKYPELA